MHTVIKVMWEESERGWGVRPDGYSLHLSKEDAEQFIKEYWAGLPDEVPDEYSRPSTLIHEGSIGSGTIDIDEATYQKIKKSKNGIRIWNGSINENNKEV